MKDLIKIEIKKYIKIILFLFLIINLFNKKLKSNLFKNNDSFQKMKEKLNLSSEINKIYSILYDANRNGYFKPIFPKMKEKYYPNTKQKSGVCVCSICKNENLYIKEFVEYHLLLGVNKIIIYDNNDINGEEIIKPLEYYIKKNILIL